MARRTGKDSIKKAEAAACARLGAKHVGGPGKVDCYKGPPGRRIAVEVKDHASALTVGIVVRELSKPQYRREEVVAVCQVGSGGLSPRLYEHAREHGLTIKGSCVVRRRGLFGDLLR